VRPERHHVSHVASLLAVIAILAVLQGSAIAQTYRWVDAQGEVHVTDDFNAIPEQYRPRGNVLPPAQSPGTPAARGGASSGQRSAPGVDGVALWVRTGGLRGEREPALIQVYDSMETCLAERDRRVQVHVSQGMQPTNQPGLAISNLGGSVTGTNYFAYSCAPAGVRRP
jgi:hypothetical protein